MNEKWEKGVFGDQAAIGVEFEDSKDAALFERGMSWSGYMDDDGQLHEYTLLDTRDCVRLGGVGNAVGVVRDSGDSHSMEIVSIDRDRGVIVCKDL